MVYTETHSESTEGFRYPLCVGQFCQAGNQSSPDSLPIVNFSSVRDSHEKLKVQTLLVNLVLFVHLALPGPSQPDNVLARQPLQMDEELTTTLTLVGLFGGLSILLMGLRLFMRKYRNQDFILSDYLTMLCIVFILARSALTTVVLLWGNNNMDRPAPDLSELEIYRRTVGSQMTLANRAIYNT